MARMKFVCGFSVQATRPANAATASKVPARLTA